MGNGPFNLPYSLAVPSFKKKERPLGGPIKNFLGKIM
jgi:hypothetical protein